MKQIALLLLLVILVLSCRSVPIEQGAEPLTVQETVVMQEGNVQIVAFDPDNVPQDLYEATIKDIRAFIDVLNRIIRARDYNSWVTHLSDSYYQLINSAEFLEERTEDLFRRDQMVAQNMGRNPRLVQRRVLRTARDYFEHIVVPSRSNDRVDDITFVSATQIIVYTVDSRGQRLILYNLKKIDNRWKII